MVCRPWSNRTRCRTSSQAPCIGNRGLHITPGPSTWLRRKRSGLPGYPPWQLSLRYTCMENRKPSSLGHNNTPSKWLTQCPWATSDLVFAIDFGTSGTSALALQPSNYVMPTLTGMSFKSRMNLRSLNCWRNIDMSGATSSFFLTSGPLLPGISAFFVTTLLPQSASRGDFTIECTASHFSSTVKHPTTRNDPRNGLGLSQESQFIYLFI